MIKKLIFSALIIAALSGCDGDVPPKTTVSITDAMDISTVFPAVYANFPKKVGGACAFDQPKIDSDKQFISGWAAISAKDGSLAEAKFLGISFNGVEKFVFTSKQKREDVVNYFKNPALMESGFSAYINKTEISAGSKVILYQVFQGGVYPCEVTVAL